jgi:hypothetical protein
MYLLRLTLKRALALALRQLLGQDSGFPYPHSRYGMRRPTRNRTRISVHWLETIKTNSPHQIFGLEGYAHMEQVAWSARRSARREVR